MGRRNRRHRAAKKGAAAFAVEYADFTKQCAGQGLPVESLWHVKEWRKRCAMRSGRLSAPYDKDAAERQGRGLPPIDG